MPCRLHRLHRKNQPLRSSTSLLVKDYPKWDDLQVMVAQMANKPLLEDQTVATELVIGPEAKKPLRLKIPLFVSDMSFGALSEEAKTAMALGAKTGTGGHLPGNKNVGKISQVRGIPEGESAISPPTFKDLSSVADFKRFADRVREVSGGIPVGFKLSANHIERDIQFALDASADYIILDGRGIKQCHAIDWLCRSAHV